MKIQCLYVIIELSKSKGCIMKINFLNAVLNILVVGLIAGCSSSGSDSGGSSDLPGGSGASTCISLNALSTPSMIVSRDGEYDLSVTLGNPDAIVQYTAGGALVWQSISYNYVVNDNNITFTRSTDAADLALDSGMNPQGAVIPATLTIEFSSNVVSADVSVTYDNTQYTVLSAFDDSLKTTCN